MISLHKNFAFVHVNKTGGTSITEALADLEDPLHSDYDHANAKRLRRLLGQDLWDEMYSFAFVRNPFARMVSSYFYRRQILEDTPESIPAKDKDFRQWILEDVQMASYRSEWNDQLTMVEEGHSNIIVDDVFFFEDGLSCGLNTACRRIGIEDRVIPHTNKTEKKPWQSYYDAETQGVVALRHSRDLEWAETVRPGFWETPVI